MASLFFGSLPSNSGKGLLNIYLYLFHYNPVVGRGVLVNHGAGCSSYVNHHRDGCGRYFIALVFTGPPSHPSYISII